MLADDPSKSTTGVDLPDFGNFFDNYSAPNSVVTGYYVSDTLTVAGVPVPQVILAVATEAGTGDPAGGIMGIGLDNLEDIAQTTAEPYPGFIDMLKNNGLINVRAYSLFLDEQSVTPCSI